MSQTTEITKQQNIADALAEFDPIQAAIQKMREDFIVLKVESLQDKAIYKQIEESRKFVKQRRVEVRKTKEKLNEDALAWQRKVNEKEKEVTEQLREIESYLEGESEKYERWQKEEKERKEREEKERINRRNAALIELKMQFDGHSYSMGNLMITNDEICDFSEEDFDSFLSKVRPEFERIQQEEATRRRVDQRKGDLTRRGFLVSQSGDMVHDLHEITISGADLAENTDDWFVSQIEKIDYVLTEERIRAQKAREEAEKIVREREGLERQKQEMKLQIRNARAEILSGLGMKRSAVSLDHPAACIAIGGLENLTQEEFETAVTEIRVKIDTHNRIEEQKRAEAKRVEEEVKRKEALKNTRGRQLAAIGFTAALGGYQSEFTSTDGGKKEIRISFNDMKEVEEEKWEEILAECRAFIKSKNEAIAFWEEKRTLEAQARANALRPDREKLYTYLDSVRKYVDDYSPKDSMNTVEGSTVVNVLLSELREVIDRLNKRRDGIND